MAPRPSGRAAARLDQPKTLVVVTEGDETEPAYLQGIRDMWRFTRDGVRVVSNCPGDPLALVELAYELQQSADARRRRQIPAAVEFDEAWAVFDVEVSPDRIRRARLAAAKAHALGVNVAISNPCFELWLILEKRDHTSSLTSCAAAETVLSTEYGNYSKEHPPQPTMVSLVDAAGRSVQLRSRHEGMDTDGNPSTNFEQLVCSLRLAVNPRTRDSIPGFDEYDRAAVQLVCGK
ncbi:MAG: RloB domain-containing protein [Actinobacteria bacterium]|nr:RloB domain-containing protein [Actinomycetota bacterium]